MEAPQPTFPAYPVIQKLAREIQATPSQSKGIVSVRKSYPLDVTLPPPTAEDPACIRKDRKRSTANEGQSTTAVTPQYRGSALPPDLKNPRPQIIRSSVGWTPTCTDRLMLPLLSGTFLPCPRSCRKLTTEASPQMSAQDRVKILPKLTATGQADAMEIQRNCNSRGVKL